MPKDQRGNSFIYILLTILIVALVGGGAYYLGTKNTSQQSLTLIPTPTPAPSIEPVFSPSPTPTTSPSPSPTLKPELLENIKAGVVSKNYAALGSFMLDNVSLIIEATECCGNVTKERVVSEMDYLNSATLPWNFDEDNPIALQLKQKNPTAFPEGVIIGTSANRLLIAFTLNQDKTKITKVYMAVDYKLHGI